MVHPGRQPRRLRLHVPDGQRLWRKNLRDNNGDGVITTGDGVDLNRNYPTRWGYDNEGSSPNPASDTYRGPGAGIRARDAGARLPVRAHHPEFLVNYHSAAELLLYGIGWQVATPSPDDVLYEAMVGDDADPAVPGYDPDISAELYTDQRRHRLAHAGGVRHARLHARDVDVRGGVRPYPTTTGRQTTATSGFNFPDDEALIQAEFEKNIPFALAVAESADDPDDPVSVVGIDTRELRRRLVRRVLRRPADGRRDRQAATQLHMEYRINGGRVTKVRPGEWAGGERYGFENDDYYAEFRGIVSGAAPATRSRSGSAASPSTVTSAAASRASTSPTPSLRTPATTC